MNGEYPTIVHIEVFIAWAKTHELEYIYIYIYIYIYALVRGLIQNKCSVQEDILSEDLGSERILDETVI